MDLHTLPVFLILTLSLVGIPGILIISSEYLQHPGGKNMAVISLMP
jgi:hypothetical protein